MTYSITYTVTAATELEAIEAAVDLLRTDVRLLGVNAVYRTMGMFWRVSLNVSEDI